MTAEGILRTVPPLQARNQADAGDPDGYHLRQGQAGRHRPAHRNR